MELFQDAALAGGETLASVVGGVVLRLKLAVTVFAASAITVHDVAPEHTPPHPTNVEPAVGLAVKARFVPGINGASSAVQNGPQSIPTGVLLTVPFPDPVFLIVTAMPVLEGGGKLAFA